jgi:hypothetical protein
MKLFIVNEFDKRIEITDKTKFIDHWAGKYYDYTNISDSIYHRINEDIKKEKDLKKVFSLMGAWKTGALSLNGKGNMAFTCECEEKYYFTGMWNDGMSSAFKIWNNLDRDIESHKNLLKEEKPIKIVEELRDKRYPGPRSESTRFGMIYTITYLHFLDNIYPIYDSFVLKALREIFNSKIVKNIINEPEQYFNEFLPVYNEFAQGYKGESRNIDKALWTFGHHIKGTKKKKQQPCCRI